MTWSFWKLLSSILFFYPSCWIGLPLPVASPLLASTPPMQNYFLFWFELVVCLVWFPTECWSLAIFMSLQYSLSRRKLCTPSSREIVQCRGTIYFYVYVCLLACLYLPLVVSGAAEASSGNRVKVAVTCHVGTREKMALISWSHRSSSGEIYF